MFAITQTDYYLTLIKYLAFIAGGTALTALFMAAVWLIVFYSHYWK